MSTRSRHNPTLENGWSAELNSSGNRQASGFRSLRASSVKAIEGASDGQAIDWHHH